MKMKHKVMIGATLAAIAVGWAIYANATKRLPTERPIALQHDPAIKGTSSSIAVPVSIDASEIQTALRQHFPSNELYRVSGQHVRANTTLQVILNKRGDFSVTAQDDHLLLKIPVHADLRVDWSTTKRIDLIIGSKSISVSHHEDSNVQFTVLAKIRPKINPDYSIDPGLDLNYTLDRGAQFKIGPIEINLVTKVREALDSQMKKFDGKIRAMIADKLKLKDYASQGWITLSEPHNVDSQRGIWVWAEPLSFHQLPTRTQDNSLSLGLGLKGRFFAGIREDKPSATTQPLPEFSQESIDESFQLNVPIIVNYSKLEQIVSEQLSSIPPKLDGHEIKFLDVEVFGGGDGKIVVGVRVDLKSEGDFLKTRGWIYVLGEPSYDPETKEFAVKNVDFDVNTKSLLLDVVAWAASPQITERLQSAMTYNLGDKLESVTTHANQYAKELKLSEGIKFDGSLEDVGVTGIFVGVDHITILGTAKGKADLSLDPSKL